MEEATLRQANVCSCVTEGGFRLDKYVKHSRSCWRHSLSFIFQRKSMDEVPLILRSWIAGPTILLLWSTKAFEWACNPETNLLLARGRSKRVYRSPKDEYDVLAIDGASSASKSSSITSKLFGCPNPLLVYNMSVHGIDDGFLYHIGSKPTVISVNRPAHFPALNPKPANVQFVSSDDGVLTLMSVFGAKEEHIKKFLLQTRVLGIPADFDPAHNLLFVEEPGGGGDYEPPTPASPIDVFFCNNRLCMNMANSDFDCLNCAGFYCSEDCREQMCGNC